MELISKKLNIEFFFIYLILQILIIFLTRLRAKRFKDLDINIIKNKNKISIVEVQAYLGFTRWVSFILPFKLGDIISFYILKKKIIKLFSSSISYFIGCKFFELFNLLVISLIICYIFFLETKLLDYNKAYLRIFYLSSILIFFLIIFYLKKNKKKILKIEFKNIYINNFKMLINSNNFFSYTFYISSIQFICTILLLFICSDRSIDNELFFLSTIYILLNVIPLRLPLNIGAFDIIAGVGNYIYDYGLSIENLILFRSIQLVLYTVDFIFWYLPYKIKN